MKSSFWKCFTLLISVFIVLSSFRQTSIQTGSTGISFRSPAEDTSLRSSDIITRNDETNIKWKAESVVKRFMKVLNVLATGLYLEVPETERIIRNSYAQPISKIFDDSTVIIADDLRHIESNKLVKEKPVFAYLKDFDIFYQKSETETVAFSNFQVSNIKKSNYLYIKVYFDCLFTNKSKISDVPYSLTRKVAELKLEKQHNKWNALIVDIHFLDSTDLFHPEKNDIVISENPAVSDSVTIQVEDKVDSVSRTAPVDPFARELLRKQNDSVRTYMAFKNLKDSGDHAFNSQRYIVAYQFYNEAETMSNLPNSVIGKSAREYLETMVKQTRKNIAVSDRTPDEQYSIYIQQAQLAKNQRKYDEAVDFYNKALLIKPGDDATKAKKHEITTWINNLLRLEAKYKSGKYKEAINDYDAAIKADPTNSDYYLGRGQCYEKNRDVKKALSDYKKAIELDENNIQAFFLEGSLHERQGSYPEALACYKVCVTNDKTNITGYLKMADLCVVLNNINEGVNALDKGISNNANNASLYNKKAELLYQQKKLTEALDNFNKAIFFDSTRGNAFYERGLCELDLKKIAEAGEDFVKARAAGIDDNANARIQQMAAEFYNDGLSKYNTEKVDAALVLINYAVAIDPAKDQYRFQRAACYFKLKDYDNAFNNYSACIKLNPENAEAYKFRGLSKFNQQHFREAIADYETAIKVDPKAAELYRYMGDAFLSLKDYNKAISNYDALLSAPKSSKRALDDEFFAELYNNKGEAYYYLDKLPLAMQNFKEAISNNRKNGQIYFNRAKTYLKINELGNAEDDFKKALEYDAKNPLWNFKFGELYQVKEKYDKAVNYYNIAIASDSSNLLLLDPVYKRAECEVMLANYNEALKDYLTIQSKNARSKYPGFDTELGNLYLQVNQPDSALKQFELAILNVTDPFPMYGKAIALAQKKQLDEAFTWLERSLALKKISRSVVSRDKRLDPLKDDKRYKSLMKKYF